MDEAQHGPRSQPASIIKTASDFVLQHTTALVTLAGVVAYTSGYLQVVQFSTSLGVPLSSFALEFRDYVLLSVANLALVILAFLAFLGVFRWGSSIARRIEPNNTWRREESGRWVTSIYRQPKDAWLLGLVVLGALAAVVGAVVFDAPGFVVVALAYATVGVLAGWLVSLYGISDRQFSLTLDALGTYPPDAIVDERMQEMADRAGALFRRAYPGFRRFLKIMTLGGAWALLVLSTYVAIWVMPLILTAEKADSIRLGNPRPSGTALDLVIRPQIVQISESTPPGEEAATLRTVGLSRGDRVVLVSNAGGQAVVSNSSGLVLVLNSADLIFGSPCPSSLCE